ncbi:ABC transporter permease [bacterium]|nr:ABC transporter permease [bacterium]
MSLNLAYAFREGVIGLQRARLSSVLTIVTIAVTLTLFGVFASVTYNLRRMVSHVREQILLEVFLDPGLDGESIDRLSNKITVTTGVGEVVYISKAEALERFTRELGEDPLEILGDNPLPASFQVRIDQTHRTGLGVETVANSIESYIGVDEVIYRGKLYELINRYSIYVYAIDGALFLLVLVSAVFLVANTLRLTILSQQRTIKIMELVGATRGFIRRPYLVMGIFQGALGGMIAVLCVWLVVFIINLQFNDLIDVPMMLYMGLWGLGVILAFWGSRIGVQRNLQATLE